MVIFIIAIMFVSHTTRFLALIVIVIAIGAAKKIRFMSTEHPRVVFFDSDYISYANITSRRYNRNDPRYYVGIHIYSLWSFHNNVTVNLYFQEFLSNRYQPGFVEMHYKMCDLLHKGLFFGVPFQQGKLLQPCPYPPGAYNMYNLTFPLNQIPSNFPFTKGRICGTLTTPANREIISACIDMEIKIANLRENKALHGS